VIINVDRLCNGAGLHGQYQTARELIAESCGEHSRPYLYSRDAVAAPRYIEFLFARPKLGRVRHIVTRTEPFTAEFPALPEGTLEIAGKTDVGLVREHNEDSFLIGNLSHGDAYTENDLGVLRAEAVPALLMVADGVGGAASGEIASSLATQVVYDKLRERAVQGGLKGAIVIADSLQQAVIAANQAIHDHSKQNRNHHGMGTTATVGLVVGGMVYFAQVGDSRAYIIREGVARQMTKDQSLVQRMVDAGKLTPEQAERSEHRNIILQALGPEKAIVPELTRDRLMNNDLLVLCSDGLSNQMTATEIAAMAAKNTDLEGLCEALIHRALDTGAPDNVTVVAGRYKINLHTTPGRGTRVN
jgi:protein phosphatase